MDEWFDTKVPLMANVFAYLEVDHIQNFQNAIKTQEYTKAYASPLTWKQYVYRHANVWTCHSCHRLRGTRVSSVCQECDYVICTSCIVCCSLCNSEMCQKCFLNLGCNQCFEQS